MRLLHQKHFADNTSRSGVHKLLLHEYNQAMVYILIAVVSPSPVTILELRKLERLIR